MKSMMRKNVVTLYLFQHMMGSIMASWIQHLMNSICQDEASVQYLGEGVENQFKITKYDKMKMRKRIRTTGPT